MKDDQTEPHSDDTAAEQAEQAETQEIDEAAERAAANNALDTLESDNAPVAIERPSGANIKLPELPRYRITVRPTVLTPRTVPS